MSCLPAVKQVRQVVRQTLRCAAERLPRSRAALTRYIWEKQVSSVCRHTQKQRRLTWHLCRACRSIGLSATTIASSFGKVISGETPCHPHPPLPPIEGRRPIWPAVGARGSVLPLAGGGQVCTLLMRTLPCTCPASGSMSNRCHGCRVISSMLRSRSWCCCSFATSQRRSGDAAKGARDVLRVQFAARIGVGLGA